MNIIEFLLFTMLFNVLEQGLDFQSKDLLVKYHICFLTYRVISEWLKLVWVFLGGKRNQVSCKQAPLQGFPSVANTSPWREGTPNSFEPLTSRAIKVCGSLSFEPRMVSVTSFTKMKCGSCWMEISTRK